MISVEKGFEMLPYAVDMFEKLEIQDFIKENQIEPEEGDDIEKLQEEQGIKLVMYILKNANKVMKEVTTIVAIAEDRKPKEVREDSIINLVGSLKKLMQEEGLLSFFKQAMS